MFSKARKIPESQSFQTVCFGEFLVVFRQGLLAMLIARHRKVEMMENNR